MVSQAKSFEFSAYRFDKDNKEMLFDYRITLADDASLIFREKLLLPKNDAFTTEIPPLLLKNLLQSLHLVLGVNYWKLFCPKKILIKNFELSKKQAEFWKTVYAKGLGEFFYRNKITDFDQLVRFPYVNKNTVTVSSLPRQVRSLVAIGGGKDSIVNLELLRRQSTPFSGLVIETDHSYSVIDNVIEKSGVNVLRIKRNIDKKIFNIGKTYSVYSGHFPISAIYAFLGISAAILYDYRIVSVANEKSADEENVSFNGKPINHQWSKSSEFETLFQNYIKEFLTPDVFYFSLLRPWYELRIAEEFSKYPNYWQIFSSCNRNFSLTKTPPVNRWCGTCPKCASVFLLLSPFIGKKDLIKIFSKNLLDDEKLVSLYKQLLGLEGIKPFECVATIEESRLALYLTWEKKEYKNNLIISLFEKELIPKLKNISGLKKKILSNGRLENIPDLFKLILVDRALILGYGKEGRATEKFIKTKYPELKTAVADKNISSDYLEKQKEFDLIIKTPGIPKNKVTTSYTTATNVFFSSINNLVIGITGSKGKSTTSSLIFHFLKSAGRSVRLIGNIGKPALESLLNPVRKEEIFVIELSSYQLEDINYSPHIAVITNLFPEHMDYHGNTDNYYLAKKNIIRYQKPSDYFIYNPENKILRHWAKETTSIAKPFDRKFEINPQNIPIPGKHNLDNLKAAITVASLLKIDNQIINSAIKSFKPLPHRLEFVGEFSGIKFYDDAISTAPESTIAAIETLKNIGTIFLGGEDRGYDFSQLVKLLHRVKIPNIVFFPATGDKINNLIHDQKTYRPKILKTENMEEAVKFAYQITPKNTICLLSTASPSYSIWRNFEEKGDLFKKFVKKFSILF